MTAVITPPGVSTPGVPPLWRLLRRWWRLVARWTRDAVQLALFMEGSPGGTSAATPAAFASTAEALEELMTEHAEPAYRVALSITRDHDLAQDVTQDAMLKAWQALPNFRGDAPMRNWVLRITHNTAISTLRKRREILKDPTEMPEPEAPRSVERQAHGRMALDAFEMALGELDELTRSIVVLREVEGLPYDEIAAMLDVPLPTVKTRLLRARRQLSGSLEGWRA